NKHSTESCNPEQARASRYPRRCQVMARDKTLLSAAELSSFLKAHPQWRSEKQVLSRTMEFPTFAEGIRYVNRVAEAADAANHHPDIDIRYNRITFALTTHDAGGLTFRDLEIAEQIDKLVEKTAG